MAFSYISKRKVKNKETTPLKIKKQHPSDILTYLAKMKKLNSSTFALTG
jgi:hypothetical protein